MPTPAPIPPEPAWTDPLLANPHAVHDKAARVQKMFSAIAPSYDLNNRLHSLWMDQHWRNVAVKMADVIFDDLLIVDVACGTGDLTIKFAEAVDPCNQRPKSSGLGPHPVCSVVGIDFTKEMLPIARRKWQRARTTPPSYGEYVQFLHGDALALPFPNRSADILSIAFGIRNVSDWGRAIDEFARVLKPGGRLIILEFSLPKNPLLRTLYNFYFRKILPRTATLISGDKTGAYKYLPESVNTFISPDAMQNRMRQAGFAETTARPLTFGICICYKGVRS